MLKRLSKKAGLVVTAALLSVLIVLSCVMPSVVSAVQTSDESVGGIVTSLATKEMKKFAYDLIDRTILAGLGKAASSVENENVQMVLNATRKILGGGQGVANSKILSACSEIQQQLSELDLTVRAATSHTNSLLSQLNVIITKYAFNDKVSEERSFDDKYRSVINNFTDLNDALQKYCKDSNDPDATENQLYEDFHNLQTAYSTVSAYYDGIKTDGADAVEHQDGINFDSDLTGYLELISPYSPSQALSDDLSDTNGWGNRSDNLTYLDYAEECYKAQIVGENQMYDLMTASIGDAASPLITYLTAYQLYASYKVCLLNSDVSYCDDKDKESDRQKVVYDTWSLFDKRQKKAVRGVYQLCSLYQNQLTSLMRGYDMMQNMQMDYQEYEEHKVEDNLLQDLTRKLKAYVTDADRKFYLIKPYGTSSVYAVSNYKDEKTQFTTQYLYFNYNMPGDYCPTQDYFNLQKTNENSRDRGFKTITNGEDLNDLLSPNIWDSSGNQLDAYLRNVAGLTQTANVESSYKSASNDYDDLKTGAYVILNESGYDNSSNKMQILNESMPILGSASSNQFNVKIADLPNSGNNPVTIIMKNYETISRNIKAEGSGAAVSLYCGGNKLADGGQKVNSGSAVELQMMPDSGKAIDTIKLYRADGSEMTTLYNSNQTMKDSKTGDQKSVDVTDVLCEVSSGCYKLVFSSPYQDCTVKVTTKNAATPRHSVTLLNSFDGDLQFGEHDSISRKEFAEGETVTFFVRPYESGTVTKVWLLDEDTTEPEQHELKNVTCSPSDAQCFAPTERAYSFVMPAQDVFVRADYDKSGKLLIFDTDKFVYDNNGKPTSYMKVGGGWLYIGWDFVPVAYNAGETAKLEAVTDDKHVLKSVSAHGETSNRDYPVTIINNDYTVTFDAENPENIVVVPEFAELEKDYTVTIRDSVVHDRGLFFVDSDGKTLPVYEMKYDEGDTVTLIATINEALTGTIVITDEWGKDITENVPLTVDEDAKTITFTMPAKNITLNIPDYHDFHNGICRDCGLYETPIQGEDGCYQIRNAGNLFWISALVRNDHTHAIFDNQNKSPKFKLMNDITLESLQWEPIPDFGGVFDGQGFTINDFYFSKTVTNHDEENMKYGFFVNCDGAKIQNFALKGKAELDYHREDTYNPYSSSVLSFASIAGGLTVGTTIDHVYSYIDVTLSADENLTMLVTVAGIATDIMDKDTVSNCLNFGSFSGPIRCAAGIVFSAAYPTATVENCANIGDLSSSWDNYKDLSGLLSGIIVFPWTSVFFDYCYLNINNCYNYGMLTAASSSSSDPIAVVTSDRVSINNCYYLVNSSNDYGHASPHSAEQFKTGETGYKLNKGVTDGTQAWYQNIDNGKTPDDYPLPDKNRGTIYYIESENRYSNYPDGNPPQPPTEPTTVEPTTVEPTTVEPTTIEPTTEPTEPTTVEPTTEPTEPTTVEPTEPTTEPATEPEPAGHGIRTYEELCEFRDQVNSGSNSDSAYLDADIIVPDGSEWTQGIGTSDKPFSGTFDGRGYCIVGLRMNNSQNEALFDYIGKDGIVKDLMVLDCRSVTAAEYAGGIAAFNEGTIDHCTSGINLAGSKTVTLSNGKVIKPSDYNSYIFGENCGGVAAVNKGTITGTRNATVVEGVTSGGIAADNNGEIYGCANNGAVGSTSSSCKVSGGIAGNNSGKIKACYNSGHPSCGDSKKQGMIAGDNSSAAVRNVFYPDFDNIPAVGALSSAKLSDNSGLMETADMKKPAFVDKLNTVTDDTVAWVHTAYNNTYFNNGFPIIQGRTLNRRTLTLAENLTVSSLMHKDLQFDLQPLSSGSEEYAKLAAKGNIIAAYSANTIDCSGNYMPAELWTAGGMKLSVPTNGRTIWLTVINSDGEVIAIAPDSVENGTATFTVADLGSFALTQTKPSDDASSSTKDSANKSTDDTGRSGSTVAGGAVQTGEPFYTGALLIVILAIVVFAYFRRRKFENR